MHQLQLLEKMKMMMFSNVQGWLEKRLLSDLNMTSEASLHLEPPTGNRAKI